MGNQFSPVHHTWEGTKTPGWKPRSDIRALISLFDFCSFLQPNLQPDPLPMFTGQELLSPSRAPVGTGEGRMSLHCLCPESHGGQRVTPTTRLQGKALHVHTAIHQLI